MTTTGFLPITREEMEDQLDKISSRLETDVIEYGNNQEEIRTMKESIADQIENAARQVEIAFSSLASGENTAGGEEE